MLSRVKDLGQTLLSDDARRKFRSWWYGIDLPAPRPAEPAADVQAPPPSPEETREQAVHRRVAVAQHLWGEGNLTPGDTEFVRDLGVQLGLTKEMSLGFFGIGLAGAARALVHDTEVWISAFEENEVIAEVATEQNIRAGLAKKIVFSVGTYETITLPPKKLDHIIAKDAFAQVKDKTAFAEKLAKVLKPLGSLVLAEYVVPGDPLSDEEMALAFPPDQGNGFLCGPNDMRGALEPLGLELRIDEDVTQRYADYAARGWNNLRSLLDGLADAVADGPDRVAMMRTVASEAALWANRIDAFRSGRLAVHRYVALKAT